MKYSEYVKPIESCLCTAWLVTTHKGVKRIELWHKDATVKDVLNGGLLEKGSTVQRVDAGFFVITNEKDYEFYSGDARKVRTDGKVLL